MILVRLNGENITDNVDTGFSFIEKLDVELDEAQINILHVDRKEQYEILDVIDIYDDNDLIFSGRILSDKVKLSSFSSELYNHEIRLIEHTKILERFIINGKSFTQPTEGFDAPQYDLLEVVEILRDTTPLETVDLYIDPNFRPFQISEQARNLLDGIISPEFNFKGLTLREALDQVASVLDGISRLNNRSELIIDRFNDLKNKINGEYTNYSVQQNLNLYASNMQVDVANPLSDQTPQYEVYPGEGLYTTFRSRDFIFNNDSKFIPTFNRIYRVDKIIFHVEVEVLLNGSTDFFEFKDIVLDERVVEKRLYETFDRSGSVPPNINDFTQKDTIFYTYGEKNISAGETFGLFNTDEALELALSLAAVKQLAEEGIVPADMDTQLYDDFTTGDEWQVRVLGTFNNSEILSRVYYKPLPTSLYFQVEKDTVDDIKYYSSLTGNQTTRIVDINDFGDSTRSKVNRLGNSELQLSHRVKNYSDSYNVGDFTEENFIIVNKEVIIDREYFTINYLLSRDFNKISQFIGIDQEIRQYEIGESGRTIERDLLYNEYIELTPGFSNETIEQTNDSQFAKQQAIEDFWNPLDSSVTSFTPIKYGTITTDTINYDILVPLNVVTGGNTMSFSFVTSEPSSVQTQLIREGLRDLNYPLRYTDESGRFDDLNVKFYDEPFDIGEIATNDDEDRFYDIGDQLPRITEGLVATEKFGTDFYVKKDNREIINMNVLYHVLSMDKRKLVVGESITVNNSWVSETPKGLSLRLYKKEDFGVYEDSLFTEKDRETVIGYTEYDEITSPSIIIDHTNNKIIVDEDFTNYDAWALVDDDSKPYFLMNGKEDTIFYSFKNKRTGIKYTTFEGQVESLQLVAGMTIDISTVANETKTVVEELSVNTTINTQVTYAASFPEFPNFVATVNTAPTITYTDAQFKEEEVQLVATVNVESILVGDGPFVKEWVSKTLSGPFDITLDLGEVSSCPGILQARDELENAFPASTREIGDKGNVTSYRITNGFLDPCENWTFEVELN